MKSTYLYSPEKKDLYKETLDEYNQKTCVFSRNLIALLETATLKQGPFYQKHIKTCRVCQRMVDDFSRKEKLIKSAIPVTATPSDFAPRINADLKEALQVLNKKEGPSPQLNKELAKAAIKDLFVTMPKSPSFYKGLLVAFGLWAILEMILH